MPVNLWGSNNLFSGGDYPGSTRNVGAQSTPYIQQQLAGNGGQVATQRAQATPYQAPPPGSSDMAQSHGSWAALQNNPQVQAQTQQNARDINLQNLFRIGQTASDVGYQQSLANLGAQLGLSEDEWNWNKQGNQLSHDQNAALLNQVINNFGRDKGFLDRQLGLQGQLRDQDWARIGLNDQGIGLDEQDLLTNLYRSRRQLDNQYVSRGAWFAPERGLSQEDLNKAWTTNQGRLDIRKAGNNIDRQTIGTQRGQDQLAYDKGIAGLNDETSAAKTKAYYNDQQLAHANWGADINWDQTVLGAKAKELGLSTEQLQAALEWAAKSNQLG